VRTNPGHRDAYRLARAIRDDRGHLELVPMAEDPRIFSTYREACQAIADSGYRRTEIVTQGVIIDAAGHVTFPPPGQRIVSQGRWHLAPNVRHWPGKTTNKACPDVRQSGWGDVDVISRPDRNRPPNLSSG
jgi:hypothetical protein